jgi:two-component system sensor histidine kinase DesK
VSTEPVGTGTGVVTPVPPAGRLGPLFAGIWLFFLINPLAEAWSRRDEWRGLVGMASTIVFAAVYMTLWWRARADRQRLVRYPRLSWSLTYVLALVVLGALTVICVGEPGLACIVYVSVACVMVFPFAVAAPITIALVVGTIALGGIEDWGSQLGTAFGVAAASVAVFGLRAVMSRNMDLVVAHEENARLAVDNERSRFARDLHDILGHSLTVITVKAELAGRLLRVDPDRAAAEIADVERLSRDALADVRRAVEGYRELTLPGELARAREALASADIEADLPNSTDEVPTELRELFAWTVREGVTNVIRHSAARRCTVRLTATGAEVCDDGRGPAEDSRCGNGLEGLRERAAAVDAVLVTRPLEPRGFQLSVLAR